MKLSDKQLATIVASYVAANKVANTTFNVTRDNTLALVDKIGKILQIEQVFEDKLSIFDGEELPLGKTVEEWYRDLTLPENYDANGAHTLAPHFPTSRPASYSYALGTKTIATSEKYYDLQKAVNNTEQLAECIADITKKLNDSYMLWKYAVKRQTLGALIGKCYETQSTATTYAVDTDYPVGKYLQSTASSKIYGVVVKPITSTSRQTDNTWVLNVAHGYIIVLDLIKTLAKPTDTASSEAFIQAVKSDVEIASDYSEGHSLNGNTLGVQRELVLVMRHGVEPAIQVTALAGAFQREELALPAKVVKTRDFGTGAINDKVYAVLLDQRGIRVHQDYLDTLDQLNAEGGFINYFLHVDLTAFISRNTFVRVYKEA